MFTVNVTVYFENVICVRLTFTLQDMTLKLFLFVCDAPNHLYSEQRLKNTYFSPVIITCLQSQCLKLKSKHYLQGGSLKHQTENMWNILFGFAKKLPFERIFLV